VKTWLVRVGIAMGLILTGVAEGQAEDKGIGGSPIYRKPFLSSGSAMIGGYIDLEFKSGGGGSSFDQHRFVPFIYAEVSDRVHVSSEIEFEHGGFVSGSKETDGEIKLEFAQVDFTFTEAAVFRAGVVLAPIGRLNVLHDAPMLDLTERPLVTRYVIPSTLSEAGLGMFGQAYLSETWVFNYEAYLVNGFNEDAVTDGVLTVRDGRGSKKADNNNSRSVVSRIGVSPQLGSEFGVSAHTGPYDDAGDLNLTILALDARFATGAFTILGEGAVGRADYLATPGMKEKAKNTGFYLEGNYHFLHGAIKALPQSVFTGVLRYDYLDRDQNVDGLDQTRITFGLNFRPTEDTVFKNDLLLDKARTAGTSDWSGTETAYRFSVATYF
jgi:hypothetical protein